MSRRSGNTKVQVSSKIINERDRPPQLLLSSVFIFRYHHGFLAFPRLFPLLLISTRDPYLFTKGATGYTYMLYENVAVCT